MKKLLILLVLFSCKNPDRPKPWVITSKFDYDENGRCCYDFKDSLNEYLTFRELSTMYLIGDTIR